MISIKHLTLFAHFVDGCRHFSQMSAFSSAGPLDAISHRMVNALVGNSKNEACIECFGGGLTIVFDHDCLIALGGWETPAFINEKPIKYYQTISVQKGQELCLQNSDSVTAPIYVAISGSVQLPKKFNSVDCVIREEGKNLASSVLAEGQDFAFNYHNFPQKQFATRSIDQTEFSILFEHLAYSARQFKQVGDVDVHLTYQASSFDAKQLLRFLSSPYQVSKQSDRMGIRLNGPAILCNKQSLTSQGIAYGSIQITGEGQAIILRNDRQTIGGYPVIGCVSWISMQRLAYFNPDTPFRFNAVSIECARQKRLLIESAFERLHKTLDSA